MTTTRKKAALIALAGLSSVTIAACGGDDGDDPAAVAEDFINAVAGGDGEAACELLTSDLQETAATATGGDCAEAFTSEELTDDEKQQAEEASYETTEESEDGATVEVTVPEVGEEEGSTESLDLSKEEDEWKISIFN